MIKSGIVNRHFVYVWYYGHFIVILCWYVFMLQITVTLYAKLLKLRGALMGVESKFTGLPHA